MEQIFLFIDYRDQFYFSTRYRGACVDVEKLKEYFSNTGYKLVVKHFYDLDLRNEDYKDKWVLYQSSEDTNLHYKDYIEDVLLALKLQGARLIPEFSYFRAHHNKVFMEFLRDLLPIPELKSINSKAFGTYEEYIASKQYLASESVVLKPGCGTRSRRVSLLKTKRDKLKYSAKISRTFTLGNMKLFLSKIKTGRDYTPMSNHRRKFIIQNMIYGLGGDYRILAYGNKYYAVYRKNRRNGFTASGSGQLDFEAIIPEGLLDYAKSVYIKMNTPFVSLDIGHKDGTFHLFEFQCISLGQYTLEKSKFHYAQNSKKVWSRVYETPDLEREISSTVTNFINQHK